MQNLTEYRSYTHDPLVQQTPTPPIPVTPTNTDLQPQTDPQPTGISAAPQDTLPWGVAQKVDDVTYTIKVGYDEHMTTPEELLAALNQYRAVHSRSALSRDDRLWEYAQGRASYFQSIQGTDKHAGFNSYLENEDGFSKLHFNRVGENSFYGGKLTGTHLIEWVFAKSPGHDANQLDAGWTHVGIGVTESSVNLNFGSGRF